ncbi:MAG TPA: DUF4438 domain-containing protein [Dongiaceae bacterium]|nr:DUF4438 domain-containing protein [Dongiaceae bacterium]
MTAIMRSPADNRDRLVRSSVAGRIAPPRIFHEALPVDETGRHFHLPASGGIALGVHMGDRAADWVADHLMPGLSIEDEGDNPAHAGALHLLAAIGNVVRDGSGRRIGVVSGKRGGMAPGFWPPQLVSVEVADDVARALTPGDRVVVETVGRGLQWTGFPEIGLSNVSPACLDLLPIRQDGDRLTCPVRAIARPEAAGPGLGQDSWIGDLEIAGDALSAGTLSELRFGDLVAFADIDAGTTRFYRPGWISIGLLSHGPSPAPGHGIGITMLITGPGRLLQVDIGESASLGASLRKAAEAL